MSGSFRDWRTQGGNRPTNKNLSSLRNLWPFLAPYRARCALGLFFVILSALSFLGMGHVLRHWVDQGLSPEMPEHLTQGIFLLMGCGGAVAIGSFGRTYFLSWLSERLISDLKTRLYRHLLTLDVGYYESFPPGELTSRLTTDPLLIQLLLGNSAGIAIRNLLMGSGGIVLMIISSPFLSLMMGLVIPCVLFPVLIYGRRIKTLSTEGQKNLGTLSHYLEESLGNIRSCYAFNREKDDQAHFESLITDHFSHSIHRLYLKSCLTFVVMMVLFGGISLVLWAGGHQVFAQEITGGTLTSFLFYSVITATSLASLSEIYSDFQRAAGAMERILSLLQAQPVIHSPVISSRVPLNNRGILALHNVTFAYPSHPHHSVLKDVSLSVAPGEKVALVGPSGSGKSTIFSLLLRFFDPISGGIYVDGVALSEMNVSSLRERFAIVPQDPAIYSTSLLENIRFGRPDASLEEVLDAARAAHLEDIIQTLPQGIHTFVGARGIRLSGGQRQRIAIARVFLRNSPILLLDEATSALDAHNEFLVQESFKKLMATRTTLVIAHRLATVLKTDRIVVLNQGRVDAVGTHAELISEDGLYRRLAMLQFSDARSSFRPSPRE